MKTLLLGLVAALAIGFFCTSDAQAQIAKKKETTETYTLIDIDDKLDIIPTEDIEAKRQSLEDAYKLAQEFYKAAKKRDPLAMPPMPVRQKLELVKTNLKDLETARIAYEREMSKRNAAKAAAAGGDGGVKKKPRENR